MILKNTVLAHHYIHFFLIFFLSIYASVSHAEYSHPGYAPWVGFSLDSFKCKGLAQAYGPYDYTNPSHNGNRPVVEHNHFNKDVEHLVKGQTGHVTQDLDFTLRAFPNHHRALLSVIRYQIRLKNKFARRKLQTPAECYLQRALNFSPKDAVSHSLYAYYLRKLGRLSEAEKHYQKAIEIFPDSSKIAYSYSLLLIDLKKNDQALIYAKKSYEHGHPPKSLKNKLIKLNIWKD